MPRASLSLGAHLALWAIRRYQRHLSPHKGFSCALRLATGGMGCSAYGLRAIERHGLALGLALLDRRLARCGRAHRARLAVQAQPARRPAINPMPYRQRGECDPGCDCDLPSGRGCASGASEAMDYCSCGPGGGDGCDRDRWRRWRERRWLAKATRQQRRHAEREAQKRRERELRERQERDRRH